MFEPQWTALADRARFIVPDLRGFGESSAGPGPSEMGTLADDVLALLDHLAIDAAVVGGVSMGGYAALALLRNDPGRVRALVLADTQTSADDAQALEMRERTAREVLAQGATALLPSVSRLLGPAAPEALRARVSRWISARIAGGPGGGTAGDGAPSGRAGHPGPLRRPGAGGGGHATTSSPRPRRRGRWRTSFLARSWWRSPVPGISPTSSSRLPSMPRSLASSTGCSARPAG